MNLNVRTLKNLVELLVLGWIRLFIENKVDNIPTECKLICKDFFGALIDTKILKMNEEGLLLQFLAQQTKRYIWDWKLLYRATEHGFKKEDFCKQCRDKGNTVVIVHNNADQVFGGYTPCKWIYNDNQVETSTNQSWSADEKLSSFLFILRTMKGFNHEPRLFKLKEDAKDKAICHLNNTAFDFGCNDFFYFQEKTYSNNMNCCYEWYESDECCYDLLEGVEDINYQDKKPKEIAIYQLY